MGEIPLSRLARWSSDAKKASGKLTITGTVSTSATIGNYNITITAANAAGKATKKITITVKA